MFTKRTALILLATILAGCTVHVRGPSDQVAYDWSESEAYNKPFAPSPMYASTLEATSPVEKASAPAATVTAPALAKGAPEGEVLATELLPKPERATVDIDISAGGVTRPPPPPAHPAPRPAPRPIPPSQSASPGGATPDHG